MKTEIKVETKPQIIDKYDGKTIRISKEGYGSRIYRISVEYIEGTVLEVNLVPLAQDGSIASSNFDWKSLDVSSGNMTDIDRYGELYGVAIRKAKDIARDIEAHIGTDFDEDDF